MLSTSSVGFILGGTPPKAKTYEDEKFRVNSLANYEVDFLINGGFAPQKYITLAAVINIGVRKYFILRAQSLKLYYY